MGPTIVPEELTDEQVLFLTDISPTSYWGVESSGMKKAVRKGGTVVFVGVYGGRYNMFPLGDFYSI